MSKYAMVVEQTIKYAFQCQVIRAERKAKRMSQRQLADRLGVNRVTIACWELGKWRPEMDKFVRLCNVLQVAPEEFFSEQEA